MRLLQWVVLAALGCLASADDDPNARAVQEASDRQLLKGNPIVSRIYDEVGVVERQDLGLGTILAIAPFLRLALVAVFAMVLATAVVFFIRSDLTSSGRGDDPDEWEINYSVWIEQLQKDLDEAWEEV